MKLRDHFSKSDFSEEDNREFVNKIYVDYSKVMFKCANRFFEKKEDAEDVVQLAFIKINKNLNKIRQLNGNSLAAYIVSIVKHTAIDQIRSNQRDRQDVFSDFDEFFEERLTDDTDIEEALVDRLTESRLKRALLKLSDEHQEILEAKYLLDMNDAEIAEEMNIKRGTVRSRLSRARQKALEIYLQEMKDEEENRLS